MVENRGVVEIHHGVLVWLTLFLAMLTIGSIAGLAVDWHSSKQMRSALQAIDNRMKTAEQNHAQQMATLEQKVVQAKSDRAGLESDLGVVEKRLRVTQDELNRARVEDVQKLAQMDIDVKSQLATKASSDDLNVVNGNVNGVKTDLEDTKSDLKMARSELGTLIARNHEEIDVLRQTGGRDYFEFTIQGRNKPQRIGDITVELRSVSPKKNQFNVILVLDDVRTENKNHAVNEPIVFYPHGSHQANEFVVNQLGKDTITGYVSMPKNVAPIARALRN